MMTAYYHCSPLSSASLLLDRTSGPAQRDTSGCRPALTSRCGRLISNLFGPFEAARRFFSRALNAFQGQARGISNLFKSSFRLPVRHGAKPSEGLFPDETKSGARPRNLTAREGKYAC